MLQMPLQRMVICVLGNCSEMPTWWSVWSIKPSIMFRLQWQTMLSRQWCARQLQRIWWWKTKVNLHLIEDKMFVLKCFKRFETLIFSLNEFSYDSDLSSLIVFNSYLVLLQYSLIFLFSLLFQQYKRYKHKGK